MPQFLSDIAFNQFLSINIALIFFSFFLVSKVLPLGLFIWIIFLDFINSRFLFFISFFITFIC